MGEGGAIKGRVFGQHESLRCVLELVIPRGQPFLHHCHLCRQHLHYTHTCTPMLHTHLHTHVTQTPAHPRYTDTCTPTLHTHLHTHVTQTPAHPRYTHTCTPTLHTHLHTYVTHTPAHPRYTHTCTPTLHTHLHTHVHTFSTIAFSMSCNLWAMFTTRSLHCRILECTSVT